MWVGHQGLETRGSLLHKCIYLCSLTENKHPQKSWGTLVLVQCCSPDSLRDSADGLPHLIGTPTTERSQEIPTEVDSSVFPGGLKTVGSACPFDFLMSSPGRTW